MTEYYTEDHIAKLRGRIEDLEMAALDMVDADDPVEDQRQNARVYLIALVLADLIDSIENK